MPRLSLRQRYTSAHQLVQNIQKNEIKIDIPPAEPSIASPSSDNNCPVCLFEDATQAFDCTHKFCAGCVAKLAPGRNNNWDTFPTCPLCRSIHIPIRQGTENLISSMKKTILETKLSEDLIRRLSVARGANLEKLIADEVANIATELRENIDTILTVNYDVPSATPPVQLVAPLLHSVTASNMGVLWCGQDGFQFQFLNSCPQVPEGEVVGEQLLRRNLSPELTFLTDNLLLLFRFGLYPHLGIVFIPDNIPTPVLNIVEQIRFYLERRWTVSCPSVGVDEYRFYSNQSNSPWWFGAVIPGREIMLLICNNWLRHMYHLYERRSLSSTDNANFFNMYANVYNCWETLGNESENSEFKRTMRLITMNDITLNALGAPKKCAGCQRLAPTSCFYLARRIGEPRRVRCEGCMPRANWIAQWTL